MQVRGAATLLLQSSLLKTLQNQEVDCTLQQLEAGGVLLGMVKGQFCDVVFCAQSRCQSSQTLQMNCGNEYITSLPKLLAAWRPSHGAGLLWQNLGNFLRSEEIVGLVGNE